MPEVEIAETRLRALLAALDAEDAQGEADQATVVLDQTSIGRLSRMDALQRQAMAQATARRRDTERARILAAIKRVEDGEYGYCTDCGEDISSARLQANPAIPRCLSCTRG